MRLPNICSRNDPRDTLAKTTFVDGKNSFGNIASVLSYKNVSCLPNIGFGEHNGFFEKNNTYNISSFYVCAYITWQAGSGARRVAYRSRGRSRRR